MTLSRFLYRRWIHWVILLLSLIPLFFINVRDSHDWGGDFALYIKQSINIVEGKAQTDNGYIFNEYSPYLSPPAYSVGFPLLLAPVYACFGNSILFFSLYLTALLIVALMLVFELLHTRYSTFTAFVCTLLLAYNPWLLSFKGEILSDIPFTLFFLWALVLYLRTDWEKTNLVRMVAIGMVCGYALLIRGIGVVLPLVLLGDILMQCYRQRADSEKMKQLLFQALLLESCVLMVYVLFSKMLFPIGDSYRFFFKLFNWSEWPLTVLTTLGYYANTIQQFFCPDGFITNKTIVLLLQGIVIVVGGSGMVFVRKEQARKMFYTVMIILIIVLILLQAFAIALLVLGLLLSMQERRSIVWYTMVLYLLIVISFPNTTQGLRYLVPILPLMLYEMLTVFQVVKFKFSFLPELLVVLLFISSVVQYRSGMLNLIDHQRETLQGPQEATSLDMFQWIETNTSPEAVIVFYKPRVLALYTHRSSIGYTRDQLLATMNKKFKEVGADYVLVNSDLSTPVMEQYLQEQRDILVPVYKNTKFVCYRYVHDIK